MDEIGAQAKMSAVLAKVKVPLVDVTETGIGIIFPIVVDGSRVLTRIGRTSDSSTTNEGRAKHNTGVAARPLFANRHRSCPANRRRSRSSVDSRPRQRYDGRGTTHAPTVGDYTMLAYLSPPFNRLRAAVRRQPDHPPDPPDDPCPLAHPDAPLPAWVAADPVVQT